VLRGRVMALYSMMLLGMAPFGALLSGAVAERLGAPVTVAAGGIVCVVGSAVFWYRWPSMRVAARELIVAQQVAGGEPAEEVTDVPASRIPKETFSDRDRTSP